MNGTLYKSALSITTALGLSLAVPATAQDVPAAEQSEQTPASAPPEASAPSTAVEASEPSATAQGESARTEAANAAASEIEDGIAEIIVTARRFEERLQDVSISITAFNQQQLTDRDVVSAGDLATYTPSLTANLRYGSDNATFAIRGFSQEIRTTSSVGVYFADVVAARGGGSTPGGDGAGPGAFFDLQSAQVLKGPQGTLFGRNTTGGAILLVPQKPTAAYEGFIEQSMGDFDLRRTQMVVNAPLAEWARMRVGVDRRTRRGFQENISGVGPKDFSNIDYTALRASLVVDLAENLENYTIASSSESSNNGPLPRLFAFDPVPVNGRPRGLSGFAAGQIAAQQGRGFHAVQNADPDARVEVDHWQVVNTTTWNATETLTVKNIASYAQLTNYLRSELFGTNFFFPTANGPVPLSFVNSRPPPGLTSSDQSTLTEELQFQGKAMDNKLVWQSGLYYENSRPVARSGSLSPQTISCEDSDNFKCYDVIGASTPLPSGGTAEGFVGSLNNPVGTIEYENFGLYAQGTYEINETLKSTVGVRYTEDKSEADARYVIWRFPQANTPVAFCGSTLTAVGTRTPVTSDLSQCDLHFKKTTSAPTWVLSLDYTPVKDTLYYGKYSRGYRQGAVSPYGADGYNDYDEEQVDTFELGMKTAFDSLLRGTLNMAAFYNDFQDQQILVGFGASNNSVSPNVSPVNAGKSRMYGVEVDSSLLLFEGFTLDMSYAYLNTKLEELADVVLDPNGIYDLTTYPSTEGSELTYTPRHKGTVTANYRVPLSADLGRVLVGLTYTYTAEQLVSKSSPFGELPSYELVNLNLNWTAIAGSPVDAGLFVTNLLDEKYLNGITGSWANAGFEGGYAGAPRMFGARGRRHCGAP